MSLNENAVGDHNTMLVGAQREEPRAQIHRPTSLTDLSSEYVLDVFGRSKGMQLLNRAGLLSGYASPPDTVSKFDFWKLCLDSINLYDDEGHGCLDRSMPKSSWSLIFASVTQMENLSGGLKRIVELLPVMQCGIYARFGYSSTHAHLTFDTADSFQRNSRSERYLDLIATVFLCVLRWGAEREFLPEKIRLSHQLVLSV